MGATKTLSTCTDPLEDASHRPWQDRLLPNVTGLLGLKFGFAGLSFFTSIVLARLLGAGGYGSYTYALAWVLLMGVPAILGMDQLIVRDVAAYQSKSEWGLLGGLVKKANRAVLASSIGLALIAVGISLIWAIWAGHGNRETLWSFWVALLLLPLITLTRLRQSALQGLHHVAVGQLPESLIQPAVFLLLVGSAYLSVRWILTPARVMILNVAATSVAFLTGAMILHKLLPQSVHTSTPEFKDFSWRTSILPLMFLGSVGVLFAQTDTLIVGAIKGPRAVGIYGIADRAAEIVQFLIIAVCAAFAPTISKLYTEGQMEKLQRRVTKIARITFLLSLPAALLLIFYGRWFLALFYGPQFVEGHTALAILSVGQLIMIAVGPAGILLIMTRHEADAAHAVAISAVTNVLLNFALVPRWNIAGAAIANTTSVLILNILMTFWVIKSCGIQSWPLGCVNFLMRYHNSEILPRPGAGSECLVPPAHQAFLPAFESSCVKPLVTIIVPVFNGDRYLKESLDSILSQTYSRIEVIVMDDASTDSTPEVVCSYGDRVKYCRQSCNRGIYDNVNDAISMANGNYIATYHADDIYEPTIVEREVDFLERYPEAGAVFCQDIFIDSQGRARGKLKIPPEVRGERPLSYSVVLNALLKYKNVFLTCPSSMVRASVYKDVGVYRQSQFRNTSDLDMWLRIARKYPIGILEDHLFRYRYGHGNSAQRYRRLRTDPERCFTIMDIYLDEGDSTLATAEALAGHEAHRAQDNLMRTVNSYILGESEQARTILRQVHPAKILGSPTVQRTRLLILCGILHCLLRLPRINFIAELFYRRWNLRGEWDKKQSVGALSKSSGASSKV